MAIYAMKKSFNNGRLAKKVIVYIEADSEKKAYEGFGAGRFWSGYSENTGFAAVKVDKVPAGAEVLSADELIKHELI